VAYRETSRMEILEVVRRWQAGESRRAVARGAPLEELSTSCRRAPEMVPAFRRHAMVGAAIPGAARIPGADRRRSRALTVRGRGDPLDADRGYR